jgi:hypothetical protein
VRIPSASDKAIYALLWSLGHGTYVLSYFLQLPQLEYLAWVFSGIVILSALVLIGDAIRRRQAQP